MIAQGNTKQRLNPRYTVFGQWMFRSYLTYGCSDYVPIITPMLNVFQFSGFTNFRGVRFRQRADVQHHGWPTHWSELLSWPAILDGHQWGRTEAPQTKNSGSVLGLLLDVQIIHPSLSIDGQKLCSAVLGIHCHGDVQGIFKGLCIRQKWHWLLVSCAT